MQALRSIPPFIRNKYFLSVTAFAVWILFFDVKDVFTQREWRSNLETLQQSKEYYITEIAKERKVSEELKSNPAAIEKYAREKYGMKRDNEDVFIISSGQKESTAAQ
jgi:cell division protein FtsB